MNPYSALSSGLQIGLMYKLRNPDPPPMEGDAIKLQSALLEPRTAKGPGALAAFFGAIWKWL